MGKVKITIKITPRMSRYQKEKLLAVQYRAEAEAGKTFTEWKKEKAEEAVKILNNSGCNPN